MGSGATLRAEDVTASGTAIDESDMRCMGRGEDALNDNGPGEAASGSRGHCGNAGAVVVLSRSLSWRAASFSRADRQGIDQPADLRGWMTREEALAIVRQIEGLASTARRDDSEAQDDMLHLVDRLREAPGVREVVREKVASIAAWTDILFSDRKRGTYGGDEEVTELLLHDCERLRAAIRGD